MRNIILLLCGVAAFVLPADAADMLVYADADGTVHTVPVLSVSRDTNRGWSGRILVGGRRKSVKLDARQVISFRRGDPDDTNQWAKKLSTGLRHMVTGKLANEGTSPGVEETFMRVAYTTEKGIKGEEAAYAARPWHNMYAVFYLIECRLKMGLGGNADKLKEGLASVEEFKKRTSGKAGRTMDWQVPAAKGTTRKAKVYGWGDTRLAGEVLLLEAQIHAALKDKATALTAFDAVIDAVTKGSLSPNLLTRAILARADAEAAGGDAKTQEEVYRKAGTTMASLARRQPDAFGKGVLTRAANRALLRGAELLLESAAKNEGISYEVPLRRFQQLKESEGKSDPAVLVGAQAGIGTCLVETEKGEAAYKALLEVVVKGGDYPAAMARSLFYLGRAAELFAKEIDGSGGDGAFLRSESERWRVDLAERFPSSEWAKKAKDK